MNLFDGIHEVVCKRADGKLYVGYFDDAERGPRSGVARLHLSGCLVRTQPAEKPSRERHT
jgi:hypothetical protein